MHITMNIHIFIHFGGEYTFCQYGCCSNLMYNVVCNIVSGLSVDGARENRDAVAVEKRVIF